MTNQYTPQWATNKVPQDQDIIKSKVVAKATIIDEKGKVIILAAFQLSHAYRFWFKFSAPSRRSPQKKWKFLSAAPISGYQGATMHMDTALKWAACTVIGKPGCEVIIRYPAGKRAVVDFAERANHPDLSQVNVPTGSTVYVNQKNGWQRNMPRPVLVAGERR